MKKFIVAATASTFSIGITHAQTQASIKSSAMVYGAIDSSKSSPTKKTKATALATENNFESKIDKKTVQDATRATFSVPSTSAEKKRKSNLIGNF
ncbi:hypothetical protein ACIPF8_18715 [Collimonas sp. NPDC087041]|uniref:hypothetical protein n=1 Tax=Collimonas sp. NPDC087041 TaxID=3363960 RepID=UPI0038027DEA